jgi:peptide/nickel transport system substrate-binding protein
VVFSIQRANMETSRFALPRGREGARKVDDLTVEIVTEKPVPVLIPQLTQVRIMSKAWAHETQRAEAQDFAGKEETYASRNANGTGPFILKTREADVKTVLVLNSNWWGKREGNVTEVVYLPIKQDSTRLAALLSGEIDLMLDPPPQDIPRLKQDPKIKVVEGNENRTIFFGMDQYRDELLYSGVKGKNPFKDKRVREAFQAAIDVNAIKTQVMRGLRVPAAVMYAPQVDGYPTGPRQGAAAQPREGEKAARRRGYPQGFEVTLDCPNNRYINDEKICVGRRRDARPDRHQGEGERDAARRSTSRSSRSSIPASTCWAGACRRSIPSTRCRASRARASRRPPTATTTTGATPIPSSTSWSTG